MTSDHSMAAQTPAIALRDVTFSWKTRSHKTEDTNVLDIPLWTVGRGERVFLYGPSGSGKTSLLNLLAGITQPRTGEVSLLGHSTTAMSARRRDRFRARHIGVVFQQFNLIPYLSVLDNVCLAAHFARQTADAADRAMHLLRALNLPASLDRRPARTLSVGQQQRVAVARALMSQPEIVLADEPSSALDSDHREAFMALLLEQVAELKTTLVFVSHDRSLASAFDQRLDLRELSRASAVEGV